ncbi:hypothetical protein QFZ65_003310 [Arthrobacter sp. B3I9]|nr:hypothetical protein [Arthrobacter sp. B3I9]
MRVVSLAPAGPGVFTGAVLKGYGGLHLTLQAYCELLRIRWEGSRLCKGGRPERGRESPALYAFNLRTHKHFFVAVAMGTEPVALPSGTALLSVAPLGEDGWLQPNSAAWVLQD